MLGFPGKLGMDGSGVWEAFATGEIDRIRAYCEVDALNTFLVFLRYELMRGRLSPGGYESECEAVRSALRDDPRPHLAEFLQAWRAA